MSNPAQLKSVITYLQMLGRPNRAWRTAPCDGLTIVPARQPTIAYYRFLYERVGGPWYWLDRRRWSDEKLLAEIRAPGVELHVLHFHGVPAGYCELDYRDPSDVELRYFGICQEFVGRKLGPYLLDWSISRVWQEPRRRYWLHTCTLDHPAALPMYQQAGFVPYDEQVEWVDPAV